MGLFAGGTMLVGVLIVGGIIDLMSLMMERHQIQDAADAAALGAVREVQIAMGDDGRLHAVARTIAESTLRNLKDVKVQALPRQGNMLEVSVTAAPRVFFPGVVGLTAKPITANALATVSGSPVCMIGLDTKVKRTLDMRSKAAITAKACGIYSNSVAQDGVAIADNARVNADLICSAGGVKLAKTYTVTPAPVTDCPAMPDPLANRPAPPVGACLKTKLKVDKGISQTLQPGTYCDGIEIKGNVTLAAGIYIIKNGSLKVKDGGVLTGTDVGFYLTGDKALIEFEKASKISLAAPRTGQLAGLLFFEDRGVVAADKDPTVTIDPETLLPKAKEHRIRSDDAGRLVGTIYLPRNRLLIDGDRPIADQSAYTVIIAREFALAEGPEVVLNADYTLSDVPVPEGVGNKSSKSTRLVR